MVPFYALEGKDVVMRAVIDEEGGGEGRGVGRDYGGTMKEEEEQ